MHTTTHKIHSITREMVKERISVYSDRLKQSNTLECFMRKNAIHYDPSIRKKRKGSETSPCLRKVKAYTCLIYT
jgi:hypothetical protein